MKEETTLKDKKRGFNTALLLNVQKCDSPPSLSPRSTNQGEQTCSLHDYLPFDLINRIETVSPAQHDRSSNSYRMSDIEMKSNDENKSQSSFNEENDEIFLNQYDNIKYIDDFPSTSTANSLSTNHKSSTGSNTSNNSTSFMDNQIKLMRMNFLNNFCGNSNQNTTTSGNSRKFSVPAWIGGNTTPNYPTSKPIPAANGANLKQKKKSKKKKKKEKDEYTIEMFGRRGWICEQCNNFNYDSRHKCNRCGIPKQPKLINSCLTRTISNSNPGETEQNGNCHKGDWCCRNCNNLNYAFRLVCNRCQMPKGEIGTGKVAYSSS